MPDIRKAALEIREMDSLANMSSVIHSLNPLVKLIVTIAYIFIVASFGKYQLSGLFPMILYPAFLFSLSGISVKICMYKLRFMIPLVCAVGIFNPLIDRNILFSVGAISITGGMVSMITLMLKGILCICASFLLAATTPIDMICMSLRKLHVPKYIVSLILLTYRYIATMVEEVSIMNTAYQLRAPGQKGIKISAWGSFLGQLLLRSMDKAQDVYRSMQIRGYNGEFKYVRTVPLKRTDVIYFLACIVLFLIVRFINVAYLIGNVFV